MGALACMPVYMYTMTVVRKPGLIDQIAKTPDLYCVHSLGMKHCTPCQELASACTPASPACISLLAAPCLYAVHAYLKGLFDVKCDVVAPLAPASVLHLYISMLPGERLC